MVTNSYSVLNSIAATGGDVSLANHILTVTGAPAMDFRKIESFKYSAYAAGTPGVVTVTPVTGTAGTHDLVISQFVKSLGKTVTVVLRYSAAAGASATNICDAWRTALNAGYQGLNLVATGTATLILTANAPDNFLNVSNAGTIADTIAVTTPAVARVGNGADLIATGLGDLYGTTALVSTNTYAQYEFVYSDIDTKSTAGENAFQAKKHIIVANTGDADFANFNTALTTALQAIATGAASIEGIAISN